jgi:hypothetical protein
VHLVTIGVNVRVPFFDLGSVTVLHAALCFNVSNLFSTAIVDGRTTPLLCEPSPWHALHLGLFLKTYNTKKIKLLSL